MSAISCNLHTEDRKDVPQKKEVHASDEAKDNGSL
jgi:hypothetical protein